MADNGGIVHYDEAANLAKVRAGMKGGKMFNGPVATTRHEIVDGTLEGVNQKLDVMNFEQPMPQDTWFQRHTSK